VNLAIAFAFYRLGQLEAALRAEEAEAELYDTQQQLIAMRSAA